MELQRPIVIQVRGKKKRRYSRGLGDFQRTLRGFSRLSARAARGVYRGYDSFYEASDKSAQKKRDGALRDFGKNLGKAASKSLKASSRVPADLGSILSTRTTRRAVRRQIKVMSFLNRRFGLR